MDGAYEKIKAYIAYTIRCCKDTSYFVLYVNFSFKFTLYIEEFFFSSEFKNIFKFLTTYKTVLFH